MIERVSVMNFLESNINLIKRFRPGIYEQLEKIIDEKKYSFDGFSLLDTKKGTRTIEINKFGDRKSVV